MLSASEIPEVFADLTPIPQNDGPDRVCTIDYPSAFSLAYNYMRAVWAAKERSGTYGLRCSWRVVFFLCCFSLIMFPLPLHFLERALKLTATCLKFNPANYTVWNFRRQCLQFLGLTSEKEAIQKDLDLAAALGGSNPKNYQVSTVIATVSVCVCVCALFCKPNCKSNKCRSQLCTFCLTFSPRKIHLRCNLDPME